MCHVLSSGPELLQIAEGGYRVACCGFREHLSQEAIGGSRVVACSQLEPLGQPPMKVPFISTGRFMNPSRPKQHLGKTMHHMRRNIFTAGEKVNKNYFIFCARFYGQVHPRTSAKAKAINVNATDVRPGITRVAEPLLQKKKLGQKSFTSPAHGFMMLPTQNPACQQRPSKATA